ncbi:hypothetical protein P3T16_005025 [Paraburkholderia sp. GAS42]|jgi:hypothetical protein
MGHESNDVAPSERADDVRKRDQMRRIRHGYAGSMLT